MRACVCVCVYAGDDTWERMGVVTRDACSYDTRVTRMHALMTPEVRL